MYMCIAISKQRQEGTRIIMCVYLTINFHARPRRTQVSVETAGVRGSRRCPWKPQVSVEAAGVRGSDSLQSFHLLCCRIYLHIGLNKTQIGF